MTTTEETTKMAEVRVKLTEVDGNRLELRLENIQPLPSPDTEEV